MKRYQLILIILFLLLINSPVQAFSGSGTGTKNDPYQITNISQLQEVNNDLSASYILMNDLDLSNTTFTVGNPTNNKEDVFNGQFDGNNHTILGFNLKNLLNKDHDVQIGFFEQLGYNSLVKNLNFKNLGTSIPSLKSNVQLGVIAGKSYGQISNCQVEGSLNIQIAEENRNSYIGVICGYSPGGKFSNCINKANLNVTSNTDLTCGGITGYGGVISQCINQGNINILVKDNFAFCGGISGQGGNISYSTNKGNVTATSEKYTLTGLPNCAVGGISGIFTGTISNCANFGNISSTAKDSGKAVAGGIAGSHNATDNKVINCINMASSIICKSINQKNEVVSEDGKRIKNTGGTIKDCYSLNTTLINSIAPTDNIGANDLNGASITYAEAMKLINSFGIPFENSTSYKLNVTPEIMVMLTGETRSVICSLSPANDSVLNNIKYRVTNSGIVNIKKVDSSHYSVEAIKDGETVIEFYSDDLSYVTNKIKVTVNKPSNTPTYTLEINPSSLDIKVGETKNVNITLNPYSEEVLKTLNFTGIDYSIISLFPTETLGEYTIKGLKAGSGVINFSSSKYPNLNKSLSITVRGTSSSTGNEGSNTSGTTKPGRDEANKIELNPSTLNLKVGEVGTVTYKIISSGSDDIGKTTAYDENSLIASAIVFSDSKATGSFDIYANNVGTTKVLVVNTKVSSDERSSIEATKEVIVNVTDPSNNSNGSSSNNSGNNSNTNNSDSVNIYRLYNNKTGEHLYTSDSNEASTLSKQADWDHEGIGWKAPSSGSAVYRLYSPVTGVHLFTTDQNEVNVLSGSGWSVDNGGKPLFYSGGIKNVYRLYSPTLRMHLITTDLNEYNVLAGQGWNQEGVKLKAQ